MNNWLCAGIIVMTSLFSWDGKAEVAPKDLYSIPTQSIEGKEGNLKAFQGKVLLIVNTASQCGYTPQYEGLEKIAKKYRAQGFEVLGFPSNDFGKQEPGSNGEIRFFCQSKYSVDFPLYSKAPVTGTSIQPVFRWLLKNAPSDEQVEWNFEKFLIGRNGKVIKRFKSGFTPESPEVTKELEAAIASK